MKVLVRAVRPAHVKADAIVVGFFSNDTNAAGLSAVDTLVGGVLGEMRRSSEIRGRENEVHVVPVTKKGGAKRVIVVGLGERANLHSASFAKLVGMGVRTVAQRRLAHVAVLPP